MNGAHEYYGICGNSPPLPITFGKVNIDKLGFDYN